MGILALYDTISIQSFIYSSNRLRDNQGASHLIEQCFSVYLIRAIENLKDNGIFKDISTKWKEDTACVAFLDRPELDCEVIYIGGGNALLYLRQENGSTWKKLNTEFSKLLLENVPGVTVVTEILKVDQCTCSFGKAVDSLFKKLQLKKFRSREMEGAPCMSVTRECSWTKKPAIEQGIDGTWLSPEIVKKREASQNEIAGEHYKEMGDLAGEKGEQWTAVIHIDGNGMGDNIHYLVKDTDFGTGIRRIREFSIQIQKIYENAYNEMKKECAVRIKGQDEKLLRKYKEEGKPPFRKIYGAGDDLTFICYGPLAIPAAEIFLQKLQKIKCIVDSFGVIKMSACAGIAFMKPGYPFSKAYELAERCCVAAKQKARTEAGVTGEGMGSYIDFQLLYGGLQNLGALRMETERLGATYGWRFYMRPYKVTDNHNSGKLSVFYAVSDWIQNSGIARSKWKELRNAYFRGEVQVHDSITRLRRRYKKEMEMLEGILKDQGITLSSETETFVDSDNTVVLWDALEMMDLYVSLNMEAGHETKN